MDATRATALVWHRSDTCGSNTTCVEVAALPDGGAAIRDGKHPQGPVLYFGAAEWEAFLAAARAGAFDPGDDEA